MAIPTIDDASLVNSYISGNEAALETLIKRHQSRIFGFIYSKVGDRDLADDIFQDTFIKVIRTLKSNAYNEEGKFLPWILRIAHNLAIDYFRRDKRYPNVVLEDGSQVFNTLSFSEESTESLQVKKESHEHLRSLIKKLPEQQREVLIMRHYEEMSFQEIAEATGVSINTALGRMRYALMNLRKIIDKHQIILTN